MIPLMRETAVIGFTVPEAYSGGKPTQGPRGLHRERGYAEALGLRLVRAGSSPTPTAATARSRPWSTRSSCDSTSLCRTSRGCVCRDSIGGDDGSCR